MDVDMDWRYHLRPFSTTGDLRSGLSAGLLHHLLLDVPLAPGSRILDAGCRSGKLVRALSQLGFSVTGAALNRDDFRAARQRCPDADIRLVTPENWQSLPSAAFQLVIGRGLLPRIGSTTQPGAISLVADLLDRVGHGGSLALVERWSASQYGLHKRECVLALLGLFGSETQLTCLPGSLTERAAQWARGSNRSAEIVCTRIRTPREAVDTQNWQDIADQRNCGVPVACCEFGERTDASAGTGSHDSTKLLQKIPRVA